MENRSVFKTKFGLIAAIGGSVVGLGNIWRFPYLAGEYGGAAFILIYILICLFISIPIMIAEMSIGREGRSDVINSFRNISKKKAWGYPGYISILSAFILLSFYSILGGWALHFLKESLCTNLIGLDSNEITSVFQIFINSAWQPIIWTFIFLIATAFIVLNGIEKGIEKYNKIFMPLIVLILLGIFLYSTTMSGFKAGITFLFKPDFSKITGKAWLEALGQSFFSLSIGMGTLITYGSYIKRKANIGKLAVTISATDMTVAILSGLAIFPAVFSMDISPTSGPSLVFITLPSVFNQMGEAGFLISVIFYILLFVAAITSSVSMLEVVVTYLKDEFNIKRKTAIAILLAMLFLSSSLCALSQVEGSKILVAGKPLFDFFNDFSGNILMPISGLVSVIFIGWVISKRTFKNQITNNGALQVRIFHVLYFLLKFVIPIVIIILFLNFLNIL